ncbi:hypothetical protein [Leifsonia shinshuensis]|uniref:Zn-dependent protease with chaperone function n=1 Tax=Leifsonia shinshuensis TaxID=150026 RepID=A0A853CPC0_9MICO|nr:hypothetical protein [Leifsonia shinshuensis]NYJ22716.1 Zn-dependent protease with chaperone function [Leifsonia shinshuensis]
MNRTLTVVVSGAVGIGLGALSGRILFGGSAWNLIPWAIVAIAIGLLATDRLTALLASGVYGYLLCAVFLYTANASNTPQAQRILFALVLGLVGPVCSIVLTLLARVISRQLVRRREP